MIHFCHPAAGPSNIFVLWNRADSLPSSKRGESALNEGVRILFLKRIVNKHEIVRWIRFLVAVVLAHRMCHISQGCHLIGSSWELFGVHLTGWRPQAKDTMEGLCLPIGLGISGHSSVGVSVRCRVERPLTFVWVDGCLFFFSFATTRYNIIVCLSVLIQTCPGQESGWQSSCLRWHKGLHPGRLGFPVSGASASCVAP